MQYRTLKLTASEKIILEKTIDEVLEVMKRYEEIPANQWDAYQADSGQFILCMDLEELKALKRVLKKL